MIEWQINLYSERDYKYLGTLYTGKLNSIPEWTFTQCKHRGKRWRKRQNAAKWAALGNSKFGEYMKARVEPIESIY